MSDVIENKVVSMLDALQNGAVEIGNQLVKYTPDVIQAALGVTMITGIQELVYGVIWLGLFIYFYRYWSSNKFSGFDAPTIQDAKLGGAGLMSIISIMVVLTQLGNVWNYVAIVNPKLYIAHEIVEKVTNKVDNETHH